MSATDFSFDGVEGKDSKFAGLGPCNQCGVPAHEHEKERVYPDDGPAGSYHYKYICP